MDRWDWACAVAVERQYGAQAAIHIAERIGALALEGDADGVARWRSIAACFEHLRASGRAPANH